MDKKIRYIEKGEALIRILVKVRKNLTNNLLNRTKVRNAFIKDLLTPLDKDDRRCIRAITFYRDGKKIRKRSTYSLRSFLIYEFSSEIFKLSYERLEQMSKNQEEKNGY